MDINVAKAVGSLITAIITIFAVIIMRQVARSRKELKRWYPSFITFLIGNWLSFLVDLVDINVLGVQFEAFTVPVILLYIITMLYLVYVARKELKVVKKGLLSTSNKAIVAAPLMAVLTPRPDAIFQLIIGGFVIFGIFQLVQLYKYKHLPSYLFMILMYASAVGNIISNALNSMMGNDDIATTIAMITSILLAFSFLVVSMVSFVEKRLLIQQEEISTMNTSLSYQLEQNNIIAQKLVTTASELSVNAENVSSSAESIASGQQQISNGASNQVISINNTQSKIHKFSEIIKNVQMEVSHIGNLTQDIQNISTQTNMLALNAAIEAARAGDAGRGFNVVAEQVRKLAEETKKSANQSESLLNNIQAATEEQVIFANEIIQSIDEIATIAEETSASTEESAAAAEEQSASTTSINESAQILISFAQQITALLDGSTNFEEKAESGHFTATDTLPERNKQENTTIEDAF